MKRYFIIFFFLLTFNLYSQDTIVMSLKDVITIAKEKSLNAFRAKNMYLKSYWNYKSYKASLLPNLSVNLKPISYRRSMTKRYDFEQNLDIFREQRNFESSSEISLNQNIALTGGSLFANSSLSRLDNFGEISYVDFNSVPFRIGIIQPIFGYNELKWERKIAPKKFEIAKRLYLKNMQDIESTAIHLYFNLLLEYKRLLIYKNNLKNAKYIYKVSLEKYKLLGMRKEQLLNLQLGTFKAKNDLNKQKINLQNAVIQLKSFLNIDSNILIKPILPSNKYLTINPKQALLYAEKNNLSFLNNEVHKIQADADLSKIIHESRFSANLYASFGLNQKAEKINEVYKEPLSQEVVLLTINIPILNWGKLKGQREIAKNEREIIYIETKQNEIKLKEELLFNVLNFNLQNEIIENAKKTKFIADEVYQLTKNSFLSGENSILELNSAKQNRQFSEENYINAIYLYWDYYYKIKKITLFDFFDNTTLTDDIFYN